VAIGFQGELETAIFIGNDLYELLIIKLIYLNVGGVADKRRAKANHAATFQCAQLGHLATSSFTNDALGPKWTTASGFQLHVTLAR
jgi:hypothetical protein